MAGRDCAQGARTCYLHAGTHKTGTTAIQRFLAENEAALARGGTWYPRAARTSAAFPGHHNLVYELLGDPLFDPRAGTLADVVAELAAAGAPRACLSSENFEWLHVRPGALRALRDALAALGYRPVVVLALREQADYAESLYAELTKHGSALAFDDFVAAIVQDGVVRFNEGGRWVFRFEYAPLVDAFAAVFGRENVVVRPYTAQRGAAAAVRELVELIDPEPRPAAFYDSAARENPRSSVGDVIRRVFANAAPAPGGDGAARAERFARADGADHPFVALSPQRRSAVATRFARDNAAVLGTPSPFSPRAESPAQERARRLFAEAEAERARTFAHA